MKTATLLLMALQCALLLSGGAIVAPPAYRWGVRRVSRFQARAAWQKYCQDRNSDMTATPALWLRIPSCGFDDLVLTDDTTDNLARHACLVEGAPDVILGHRDTHFRALRHLALNDTLEVQRPDGKTFVYRVTEIEVLPVDRANQRLHEHRDTDSLALMTCHPFRYVGAAPNRFLVWARPG